jgi:hypothetical protein
MELNGLAQIACYLNLATDMIKAATGSLNWLTGGTQTVAFVAGASQETQCLSWGNTIWIANNSDDDSDTQRLFLNALGIDTGDKLLRHIKDPAGYARRVFPAHAGALVPTAFTAKDNLFYSLIGNGLLTPGALFVPAGGVTNTEFSLAAATTAPLKSGLNFVKGNYTGDAGTGLHAEQKLLAALGKLCVTWKPQGKVNVGGVKPPCTTCGPVLKAVYYRMISLNYGTYLQYETQQLTQLRTTAGLPTVGVTGIRALDVNTYFV